MIAMNMRVITHVICASALSFCTTGARYETVEATRDIYMSLRTGDN